MDWSPDSRWLVMPDRTAAGESLGLFAVSVETGAKRRLTSGTALGDFGPAFSPDGRTLSFTRALSESRYQLCLLKVDADLTLRGEPRPLTDPGLAVNMSHWSSDGRGIVFSAARAGSNDYGLWYLELSGGAAPKPLAFARGNVRSFAVARTGNRGYRFRRTADRPARGSS